MLEQLSKYNNMDYDEIGAFNFELLIRSELASFGKIKKQVRVADRGDGRSGRIDMVLYADDGTVHAFELDRSCEREKSIYKLQHFPADKRYIILRSPFKIIEICAGKI